MSTWKVVGGVALTAVGIPVACSVINTTASVTTAPGRVIQRTLTTDNIVSNYEWFKQQVQDVGAMDRRLETQHSAMATFEKSAGPRSDWTFEDRTEHARLNAIIAGLEGQRAAMVAEYNARTQMANRDLFRTNDLPETLN